MTIFCENISASFFLSHTAVTPRPDEEKILQFPEGHTPRIFLPMPAITPHTTYSFPDRTNHPLPAYDLFHILINPHNDFTIESNTL